MKSLLFLIICDILFFSSRGQADNLDYFVSHAISNSPLLKDYNSQIRSISLDSQILRATLKPQVNGISNNSYAPIVKGYGYDEVITNGQQISTLLQVSKSFLGSKTIASQIASLQLQSQAIANAIKMSEQEVIKTVTDQYITTYGEQLQIDFNREIDLLLEKEDSLLKKMTQQNVFRQTDYLAFTVTVQQQTLNTLQLEIQYNFDYTTLNYLAGIVDTLNNRLRDPQLSRDVQGEFYGSVFYRQFELDSMKLTNDRLMAGLAYRPKISAYADGGYNSSMTFTPYKNFGTSVGLSVTIPIYDGKQKKLQYSKINIQETNRAFKKDYFIRQHDQQILQLVQQLNATNELIGRIDKQIKYTQALITANEKLLASGDIKLTDFILSLNTYISAKNLITQNYISRLKIINQLNYWNR